MGDGMWCAGGCISSAEPPTACSRAKLERSASRWPDERQDLIIRVYTRRIERASKRTRFAIYRKAGAGNLSGTVRVRWG